MKRVFVISGIGRTGGSFITRLFDSTLNTNSLPNEFKYSYFDYYNFKDKTTEKNFSEFRGNNSPFGLKIKNLYNKDKYLDKGIPKKIYKNFLSNKIENITYHLNKEIDEYNKLTSISKKVDAFFMHSGVINKKVVERELKNYTNSYFIFTIKSPLDVYCSWKTRYRIDYSNQVLLNPFINAYFNYFSDIRYFISNYTDRTYMISYEKAYKSKSKELKKICKFLNIQFNTKMCTPTLFGKIWYGNSMRGPFKSNLPNYCYNKLLNKNEIEKIKIKLVPIYDDFNNNLNKFNFGNVNNKLAYEEFELARKKILRDTKINFFYNLS